MSKQYIDCTPKWAAVVNTLILLVEAGNDEGQAFARNELMRMARLADSVTDFAGTSPGVTPSPQLMLHEARSLPHGTR